MNSQSPDPNGQGFFYGGKQGALGQKSGLFFAESNVQVINLLLLKI